LDIEFWDLRFFYMSGHSKWSKVKHQKATTDVVKSAAFTKATHAIMIAAREGGGARLRLAIERARAVNMPKENIERAVARAAGEGGVTLEQITYEAYGPGGIAMLIETATDNRNRSVSEIKNLIERAGGTLTSPGGVAYIFDGTMPKPGMAIAASPDIREKVERLIAELEALDDVLRVFTNLSYD
jgi:YebC/PmpR family DNA-binding regulatory protein